MKRIIRLTEQDLVRLVKRVILESEDDTYKLYGVDVKVDKDNDNNIKKINLVKGYSLHDYGKHLNQDDLDKIFTKELKKLLNLSNVEYSTSDFHSKASWGIDLEQLNKAIENDEISVEISGGKLDLKPGKKYGKRASRFKFHKPKDDLTEQDLVKLVKRVINEATEGLDDFIEQLKSKFDLSDELVDEIKLIFEKANCKKVSIENIKPMGMASDEILIISTRLFNSNKINALFIIFHELGHSYQFKKYGADKMGDFFINDISLDDAALALSQYEAVADEFAKRKLRELKNKGLIDFENLGLMGYGNPSPGQFKGMLQFYRNEFKKLGIKDVKKAAEYMYNLAKIN